jgi:hypothetical protein
MILEATNLRIDDEYELPFHVVDVQPEVSIRARLGHRRYDRLDPVLMTFSPSCILR